MTATLAASPDTFYGWGILQAQSASEYSPSGVGLSGEIARTLKVFPNPCRASFFVCAPASAADLAGTRPLRVFDVKGRLLLQAALPVSGTARIDLGGVNPAAAAGVVFIEVPGFARAKVLVVR
jgi:hypothetical protein